MSFNPQGLPQRVAVDEEVLEQKIVQLSNLNKNQKEHKNDNDSGEIEVDSVDIDDAARKVKDSSIKKWKWLQDADTPRRIELNSKWKQKLDEGFFVEKKGVNQYRCHLDRRKEEETMKKNFFFTAIQFKGFGIM